jgi:peptide/nickel transport system substrate-binding protein
MQHLINQPEIANDIFHGAAYPDYGPVPTVPPNPYSTQQMKTNPYPYSVSAAKSLLASHGWTVRPGGTSTCARPGTASNECGAGIASGAKMSFNELVATGSAPFTAETETMQSSWSRAGIQVTLRQESPGAIYSSLSPCKNGNSGCVWQMANFGSPGETPTYSPEYLPTGGPWFATDGANNVQGYSNPKMDALIAATEVNSSPSAVQAFGAYAQEALPNLWEPDYYYQLSVISNKLHGALPQDPNLNLYPQNWTISG